MKHDQVTVFGGTGFVGRRIVRCLCDAGFHTRIAVRHPGKTATPGHDNSADRVSEVYADVREEASVKASIEGSRAVINAVSLFVEKPGATFDDVHVHGAQTVAQESKKAGVENLVYLSGLGLDPNSRSPYVRARTRGESVIRSAFPEATILRPSVIVGPGDSFFQSLSNITRFVPILPLFGAGNTLLQPVCVDDVAKAAAIAAAKPEAQGKTYELGGPQVYSYAQLVKMLLERLNRKRLLIPMPFKFWEFEAMLFDLLPNPPLTRDQVILMESDNVVDPNALTLTDLGIEPSDLESRLASFLDI